MGRGGVVRHGSIGAASQPSPHTVSALSGDDPHLAGRARKARALPALAPNPTAR